MPTIARLKRKATIQAQEIKKIELINNMPEHILNRKNKNKSAKIISNQILNNLLNSEDPKESKLLGGLMRTELDGSDGFLLKTGNYIVHHNEVVRDARDLNIENLKNAYPDHWLKRGGAKFIAISEKNKDEKDRAVKASKYYPKPISERTLQNYFREIRRASSMP